MNNMFLFRFGAQHEQSEVKCTVATDDLLIVAGYTDSDFIFTGATGIQHAFVTAIDEGGAMVWSKFFYNFTSPIESIVGCEFKD